MKGLQALIDSNSNSSKGNHHVRFLNKKRRKFIYYGTVICDADDANKIITIANGGWNTSSTTRAINFYVKTFQEKGYSVIDSMQ